MTQNLLVKSAMGKFAECIESEFAESFLETLLGFMKIIYWADDDFRRNIDDFEAKYLFKSLDGSITVAAIFKDSKLEVIEQDIQSPDITVKFKDSKALMGYLLTPKPDILGSMLRQEVILDGNLNYLYKFAYMAKRLQLMATGKI